MSKAAPEDTATPKVGKPTLVARPLVDFSPWQLNGAGPLAVGFGPDGSVYVAAGRTTEALANTDPGQATFPKSRLATGVAYSVFYWQDGLQQRVELEGELINASYIQPTARGFLLVGARCYWRPDGAEENAVEYDWHGRVLQRFTLGDGIQDVRTTANGTIWVSYFDEGIFGNYGWSNPGPECIGSSGCVSFDANGAPTFRYSPEAANTDAICDAYALNVAGDDNVWLYFYTDFPIVNITNGSYRGWTCGLGGAHALAVDSARALLFGDYKVRNLVRIVSLGVDGTAALEAEMLLTDESGVAIDAARGFGVGKQLYVVRGHEVLVVEEW